MRIIYQISAGLIGLSILAFPALAEGDSSPQAFPAQRAFFVSLVEILPGEWDVRYANGSYDNPTGEWRETRVKYSVTSGGTALIENYVNSDDEAYMTTVYHLDNNDIRATHYCGAMNHPNMVSRAFDEKTRTLSLEFAGVSNLDTPDSYHSRDIELSLVDENNVHVTFYGLESGKKSSRVFAMTRSEQAVEPN